MKQNKKRKKALIKRSIRRIAYTTLAAIMLSCVALVSYILLIDRGILKIHPVNRIEVASEPNTGYVYQQVVIPNIKVDTDESKPESNKEETLETDAVYVCQGTVTGTIDNIDSETKSQNASESNTSTANGNVAVSEEVTIDTTPKSIEVGTIGDVDIQNVMLLEKTLDRLPTELVRHSYDNGWIYCVTDENIGKVYMMDNNQYKAAIVWGKKMIVVEDRSEAIDGAIHEAGHYLDGINNRPSASVEFHQIYLDEAETFKANIDDGGCVHSQSEFFAHTFYYYVVDPSKCTPKAYQYIESQLKILEERSL